LDVGSGAATLIEKLLQD